MANLSRKIKDELFRTLNKEPYAFEGHNNKSIISFLTEIWDLDLLPSNDHKYTTALGDFNQHLFNNNDYNYDYVFIERLKLLDNDEKFIKFVETTISPKFRNGESDINKFFLIINPYLEKDGYSLTINSYDENGQPVYKVIESSMVSTPNDIKPNDIVFFVEKKPTGNSLKVHSHARPQTYPSFVLVFNNGWNDYGVKSSFSLFFYHSSNEDPVNVGALKVIHKEENNIVNFMAETFTSLDDNFYSLGQEFRYYSNLYEILGRDFRSVLYALRDSAFFIDIQEIFQNTWNFKNSLIRFDEAERLLREAPYRIYDYDLSNLYSFKYCFEPAHSNNSVDVEFNFNANAPIPNRVYAIIGKNGAGKTQLITTLPILIAKNQHDSFIPKTPLFSKIIAVSYSVFDSFDIPVKSSTFNYIYCGIRKENKELLTKNELVNRFQNSCQKIKDSERIDKWVEILLTFISEELVSLFIKNNSDEDKYEISMPEVGNLMSRLSSGQSIILYVITEIVANIRYDSLLLFDEPETHLHPNAITQLMSTIYELVERFQSYCIIATHSPLVIREIFSKNVYVMECEDKYLSVRRIPLESFGENISILTEEIFGNRVVPKHYKKIISKLVKTGASYEEIVSSLEFDEIPLSLNARIYIKSVIENSDKQDKQA